MTRLQKKDWVYVGRWEQPTLSGCFWCYWDEATGFKELAKGHTFRHMLFLDGHTLIRKEDFSAIKHLAEGMVGGGRIPLFIRKFNQVAEQYEKNHLSLVAFSGNSHDFLVKLFKSYQDLLGIWELSLQLGDQLQNIIFKEKIIDTEARLFEYMKRYTKTTWLEGQSRKISAFAKVIHKIRPNGKPSQITAALIRKYPQLNRSIKKFVSDFRWYGTFHWRGEQFTFEKCLQQIRKQLSASVKHESIKSVKRHPVLDLFCTVAYWRTHCAEVTSKVVFLSRPKLTRYARQIGLTYEQLTYFSAREIIENRIPSKQKMRLEVHNRQAGYGCTVDDNGNQQIITNQRLKQVIASVVPLTSHSAHSIIKGMVANRGDLVTGIARVLISSKDFKSFKNGEILVAPETAPSFIPYMKKASAIVTDRGGITSHAAIVSRELNIPCIIGTTVATQVIKSGDRVRVDAQTGQITKV